MKWTRHRYSHLQEPDLENGSLPTGGEQPANGTHRIPERADRNQAGLRHDDYADRNDNFWKLFLDEATSEAQYKVENLKKQMDSLLVFIGLFAAVVSAFLVDVRRDITPGPQFEALKEIVFLLRNDSTALANSDLDEKSPNILGAVALWYVSLVITLLAAFGAVLAQRWLGELLQEIHNNPADRALDRWGRDKAAIYWQMPGVLAAIPILIQVGLVTFFVGFLLLSFEDGFGIELPVTIILSFGALVFLFLAIFPHFCPDFPYRILPAVWRRDSHIVNANTDTKIAILQSRLKRSSNDQIFCAAVSMLGVKLESDDWEKWYKSVERHVSKIPDALAARLKSFAHQVQTIREGHLISLSSLQDTASSGTTEESLARSANSPIEQGIICLRVLLKCIEASMKANGDISLWVRHLIDPEWRSSNTLPEAWRLLSWSIDITTRVATKDDYDPNVQIDWAAMIRNTFSDLTLRSIVGASICRGLLYGEQNVKRACALGLAVIIEIEATTDSPKYTLFDDDSMVEKGMIVTERLWSELEKISKDAATHLLNQTRDEEDDENSFVELLLDNKLYKSEVRASSSKTVLRSLEQLENDDSSLRRQAILTLVVLSQHDVFKKAMLTHKAIARVVAKFEDSAEDVREAAVAAFLGAFGAQKLFQRDIRSSIPDIIQQLDNKSSDIRGQTVKTLTKLSDLNKVFRTTLKSTGIVSQLVAKLKDGAIFVRSAIIDDLLAFTEHRLYQAHIESSIPAIMKELDDAYWGIRVKAVQILVKFSKHDVFRKALDTQGIIPTFVTKLEDVDRDVRKAVVAALRAYCAIELYQCAIKSCIPMIVNQLGHDNWAVRMNAARMLTELSGHDVYRKTISDSVAVIKLISKLKDDYEGVRGAAVDALLALGIHSHFQATMSSKNVVSYLFDKLSDNSDIVRSAAVRAMSKLGAHEIYKADIISLVSIPSVVTQLQDESWSTRQHAIQLLTEFATNVNFQDAIIAQKITSKILNMLCDDSVYVRTAAAQALSVLGTQESLQENLQSEGTIPRLVAKLKDSSASVRSAARTAFVNLSAQEFYQNSIITAIPDIVSHLEENDGTIRQQGIQMLIKLSQAKGRVLQEALKTEGDQGLVSKLVNRLKDDIEEVCSAAAEALLVLGMNADTTQFLPKVVLTLNTVKKPVRMEIYKVLIELRNASDSKAFLIEIDTAICKLLTDMKYEDLPHICETIAILAETTAQGLIGDDLKIHSATNQLTRNVVEFVIRSKLVYDQYSRKDDVVLALLRLAKNDVFIECMKSAIPGLTEAVSNNAPNIWSVAVEAIAALSRHDEFRADLVPAVQKFIQRLSKDDEHSLNFIEAMSALVEYKEFQIKLKHIVPILMNRLLNSQTDVRNDGMSENGVAFYKAVCGLISKLCKTKTGIPLSDVPLTFSDIPPVGRDLVPQLTPVLASMDISLTGELLDLVKNLTDNSHLTMNDCIALASSLRITSPVVPDALEAQLCKLKMVAMLHAHAREAPYRLSSEYSFFLGAVLGNDNNTVKSTLSSLIPRSTFPNGPVQSTDGTPGIMRNANISSILHDKPVQNVGRVAGSRGNVNIGNMSPNESTQYGDESAGSKRNTKISSILPSESSQNSDNRLLSLKGNMNASDETVIAPKVFENKQVEVIEMQTKKETLIDGRSDLQ